MWDGKLTGDVFSLPGGPAQVALGAEYRKETIESESDPVSAAGLKLGSASVGTNGDRNLKSVFAELVMPFTKELELTLATRHERYSDFGSTTNPKVAMRFQPSKNALLRASYGTSFKAPTLFQLYEAQSAGGYEELVDTLRCPITGTPDDCDGRLIETRGGGALLNGIDLKPEESKNLNLGVVVEPIDGLSLSMDFWRIKKTNAITQNGAQAAIDDPGSPLVLRNPTVAGVPGTIIRVTQSYFNANRQDLEGVDLDLTTRWTSGATKFTASAAATYLKKFDQYSDGCSPCSFAGNFDGPGEVPRLKGSATLRIENGPWNWSVQGFYTGSFKFGFFQGAGATQTLERVPEHFTFDAQVAYTGFKNLELRVGMRNLLDEAPQLMPFFPAGWDTAFYDGRGRFGWVAMNYKFK
jgi:iron complex outermembrane receptor protein